MRASIRSAVNVNTGNGISAAANDMKCVFTIDQSTGSTGGRRRFGVNRWPRLTVIVMMDTAKMTATIHRTPGNNPTTIPFTRSSNQS